MTGSVCTFHFMSSKSWQKVAIALIDTHFHYSFVYGEVQFKKTNCITVWGDEAIENVRSECKAAGIIFEELYEE